MTNQEQECFEAEPLPADLAARMRTGELPFVIAVDSANRVKLFYVEGNAPTEPCPEDRPELLATVQLSIETCGCVDHRQKRYIARLSNRHRMFTNLRC